MSWRLKALQLRRLAYRGRTQGSALERCWRTPLPPTASDWRDCRLLACDAEMSGLDPANAELLSLGWVVLDRGAIQLDSAEHHLIQSTHSVGQSAAIHQLRDCDLADARPFAQVAQDFLTAAAGSVLVFHHATLDLAFLDQACRKLFQSPLLLPFVDTMAVEQAILSRRDQPSRAGELRLQACRDRYNLPRYPAHNALVDALATAELLAAQAAKKAGTGKLSLRELM